MANLKSFLRRLQTLWRSEQLHREIAEEMRFHIDQRTADNTPVATINTTGWTISSPAD
jgi:hypothetical protein